MYKDLFHNFKLDGIDIDKIYLFSDDNREPIVLPCLWSIHIAIKQEVWGWHTTGNRSSYGNAITRKRQRNVKTTFKAEPATENTLVNYIGHVYKLLKYINSLPDLSIHHTENITTRFLNHYLNQVLPNSLSSITSLKAHQSGIAAYCNFLCALGVWPKDQNRPTTIYKKTIQWMAEKDTRPLKISYVATDEYNDLLRNCTCARDKLILQMGYEVGLRAEENCGLELNDHGKHRGLISIFEELKSRPEKMVWEYVIRGKYTKGGKTGVIYFDRELLESMKIYHDGERATTVNDSSQVSTQTLFVRNDNVGKGLPISAKQATTTFRRVRALVPYLNQALSYHDLRHSFATQLYHQELQSSEGQETRSESAALEVVRQRLRHSENSKTVYRYIRLHMVMLNREAMVNA
ncbi:tyrosine-type recombinase/integrase [Vibrio astriarenae]|uniref:Tyrosine-type recombinase/integrase n=1 Tax=Vibrio astriarenae TaxID=1481923 RepID=A0A7Z2YCG8_9VIBR|nr:site-specific integrase [Vibrio astriarenae]QIA62281.1 tyrosine-type recombinase/integrase [Vibrio astriarenae]